MQSGSDAARALQSLTDLATGLHDRMRGCDGEVCLELLILLIDGERGVSALARMLSLDMPAISSRLTHLRDGGLVIGRSVGPRRFYSLSSLVRVRARGVKPDRPLRPTKRAGWFDLRIRAGTGGGELVVAIPEQVIRHIRARWKEIGEPEIGLPPPATETTQVTVAKIALMADRIMAKRKARKTTPRAASSRAD